LIDVPQLHRILIYDVSFISIGAIAVVLKFYRQGNILFYLLDNFEAEIGGIKEKAVDRINFVEKDLFF
jgi:hypothetical protein